MYKTFDESILYISYKKYDLVTISETLLDFMSQYYKNRHIYLAISIDIFNDYQNKLIDPTRKSYLVESIESYAIVTTSESLRIYMTYHHSDKDILIALEHGMWDRYLEYVHDRDKQFMSRLRQVYNDGVW